MRDDDEIRTVPSIPAQRRPETTGTGPVADGGIPEIPDGRAESRGSRGWVRWTVAGLLAVVVVVGVVVVAARSGARREAVVAPSAGVSAGAAVSAAAVPTPVPTATSPHELAEFALRSQTAAVGTGDEALWLSVVDPGKPALQQRYRAMFRALRALGITRFEYVPGISKADKKDLSAITFPTNIWYCFGPDTCREDKAGVRQTLTMKPVGGRYVITAMADLPDPDFAGPTPWQSGKLVFAVGKRVTVAADPSEAEHISEVLPLAEKAAAANDPFAKTLLAEQTRYRVYLAGEKQWKTWYGGVDEDWVVGLAVPISTDGYDVVLRVSAFDSTFETQLTLQHEFGHVVTLTGAATYRPKNRWLSEGVAEYIGWSPRPATASARRDSVQWSLSRKRPASMIPADPGRAASLRAGDAYYGLSHFAVDCLARKYGQDKMFRFVRLVLLRDEPYDAAARDAFKVPFATVDKACAAWVRERA